MAMETKSSTLSFWGLATPLAQTSLQAYRIFDGMSGIAINQNNVLYNIRMEGLRLRQWGEAWGIVDMNIATDNNISKEALQNPSTTYTTNYRTVDPNIINTPNVLSATSKQLPEHSLLLANIGVADYKYRCAVAALAKILAVFANVDILQIRYGIHIENGVFCLCTAQLERDQKQRHRFLKKRQLNWFGSSKSSNSKTSTTTSCIQSNKAPELIPTIDPRKWQLLEHIHPQILLDKNVLPEVLAEEISTMPNVIAEVQQSVSVYSKLHWVINDQAPFEWILKVLKGLTDELFEALPIPTSAPAISAPSGTSNPTLLFDIPFHLSKRRKNLNFVEREDVFSSIRQQMTEDRDTGKIIVLHGDAGMGKTELALEYVYRYEGEYTSVFWINASSKQTTQIGFMNIMKQLIDFHAQVSGNDPDYSHIGHLLEFPGKINKTGTLETKTGFEERVSQIIDTVKRWFATKGNTKWLLVLDNCDDLDFDINEHIPVCNQGTVVIISRTSEITQGRKSIEIQEMKNQEAKKLLLRSAQRPELETVLPDTNSDDELQACAELVTTLGCLPLSLDLAGSYICTQKCSFRRYLKEYQKKASDYLQKGNKLKNNTSVFCIWELSFEAIEKHSPKAAELLLVCGNFHNEDIFEEFLRRGMDLFKHDLTLDNSIDSILSYSMAKRMYNDDSFTIHPLVQEWARTRLEIGSQPWLKVARMALEIVRTAIEPRLYAYTYDDNMRPANLVLFEHRMMPHVAKILKLFVWSQSWSDTVCFKDIEMLERLCFLHGHYNETLKLLVLGMSVVETWAKDSQDFNSTVTRYAREFEDQGEYDRAIEWYTEALAVKIKELDPILIFGGPVNIMTAMAEIFILQGKYDKALEYFQRALDWIKNYYPIYFERLPIITRMGDVLRLQGNYDRALELYQFVLDYEKGGDNEIDHNLLDYYRLISEIALVFQSRGKFDVALEALMRALAAYEDDASHSLLSEEWTLPKIKKTLKALISLHEEMGEIEKADMLRPRLNPSEQPENGNPPVEEVQSDQTADGNRESTTNS